MSLLDFPVVVVVVVVVVIVVVLVVLEVLEILDISSELVLVSSNNSKFDA